MAFENSWTAETYLTRRWALPPWLSRVFSSSRHCRYSVRSFSGLSHIVRNSEGSTLTGCWKVRIAAAVAVLALVTAGTIPVGLRRPRRPSPTTNPALTASPFPTGCSDWVSICTQPRAGTVGRAPLVGRPAEQKPRSPPNLVPPTRLSSEDGERTDRLTVGPTAVVLPGERAIRRRRRGQAVAPQRSAAPAAPQSLRPVAVAAAVGALAVAYPAAAEAAKTEESVTGLAPGRVARSRPGEVGALGHVGHRWASWNGRERWVPRTTWLGPAAAVVVATTAVEAEVAVPSLGEAPFALEAGRTVVVAGEVQASDRGPSSSNPGFEPEEERPSSPFFEICRRSSLALGSINLLPPHCRQPWSWFTSVTASDANPAIAILAIEERFASRHRTKIWTFRRSTPSRHEMVARRALYRFGQGPTVQLSSISNSWSATPTTRVWRCPPRFPSDPPTRYTIRSEEQVERFDPGNRPSWCS